VTASSRDYTASQAAHRLGVSRKALLLYERHGLIAPQRTDAGWRLYGPADMARAAAIVELRGLGLSLSEVKRVLGGEPQSLDTALSAHQAQLRRQIALITERLRAVNDLRAGFVRGHNPAAGELDRLLRSEPKVSVAFGLPWPWGAERFEFISEATLIYIVGPLGSGKTRLAEALAGNIDDAIFVAMERDAADARARLAKDASLADRVNKAMQWLAEEGATETQSLLSLLVAIEGDPGAIKVIDMIENGLDEATQAALTAWLRRPGRTVPIFAMTRSSAILDLASVGPDEAILFCPANHSSPFRVIPYPGAQGYEVLESCLATPEVRARTAGTIAWRPSAA
jgi:DNA-binding transcriptional MerR regulator